MKKNRCSCGYEFDEMTVVAGAEREPNPGDYTYCIACGRISEFVEGLELRLVSEAELDGLPSEHRAFFEKLREVHKQIKQRYS